MKIAISPTPKKVDAGQLACDRARVSYGVGVVLRVSDKKPASKVSEQPLSLGIEQTSLGARYRASVALAADAEATHGLGVENGLMPEGGSHLDQLFFLLMCWTTWSLCLVPGMRSVLRRWLRRFTFMDLAFVALVDRLGRAVVTTSAGIQCPTEDAIDAILSRQHKTAGSFIAARTGCDGADWHELYTGGRMGRVNILADAIFTALVISLQGARRG